MNLSSVLQLLNVIFLALFGAAGGRLVNEWRKSREERHRAELALREQQIELCRAAIESQKATHKYELEKLDVQITRLNDDNQRLSQKRDEGTALLEREIKLLEAQAPAGMLANLEALKKLHAEQLLTNEKHLRECQSALSKEQLEHQSALKSQDMMIEQAKTATLTISADWDNDLQTILAPRPPAQLAHLERDRKMVSKLAAGTGTHSQLELIERLGHWDYYVRNKAAQELASRGAVVVPELVAQLSTHYFIDLVLWPVGRYLGEHVQRYAKIITVLSAIGDPAIPELEGLLRSDRLEIKTRALVALRLINTQSARDTLASHEIAPL